LKRRDVSQKKKKKILKRERRAIMSTTNRKTPKRNICSKNRTKMTAIVGEMRANPTRKKEVKRQRGGKRRRP